MQLTNVGLGNLHRCCFVFKSLYINCYRVNGMVRFGTMIVRYQTKTRYCFG